MKTSKFLMSAVIVGTLFLASCSPKDADIQAAVQAKEAAGIAVSVAKGAVTLTGEVADDAAKAKAEEIAKAEKGVKSVVNNLTVKPAAAPVVISEDPLLTKNVADATKDFPTVEASVKDGVVTLTGEIKKASLITLMQHLSALKPKKIENKLTVK
ncbi:BON domain-containing protein [Pedobacter agri]|uniref:BON domain-containing protein n=1 Tax=Pedobacter agri TaxID=454586 RepID=UPI002930AF7C|nr:BON domain-containing protein [Pedobacter agri]